MSCHLNYCVQCRQIDKEGVNNCRWLNFSFCHLNCLKQFYASVVTKCDLCKAELDYNRIYLRDDVKNSHLFTFICDKCFDQRKQHALSCHYCASVCYMGYGTQKLTTTGLIPKYVCSDQCMALSTECAPNISKLTQCSECGLQRKCIDIYEDSDKKKICSVCVEPFQIRHEKNFESCHKCTTKFITSHRRYENVVVEGATRKVFCCKKCVHKYLREDSQTAICCTCRHPMPFYNCIRRTADSRSFCSLHCSIAAETNAELLMQNDQKCHLNNLSLKCATINPKLDSNDSNEGLDCILLDRSIATASDQVSERKYDAPENELSPNETMILNEFETFTDVEGLLTVAKLQEPTYVSSCSQCHDNIKINCSFLQWGNLEFCKNLCYEKFMYEAFYRCSRCNLECTGTIGPNQHIIDNELYHFCGEDCEKQFFGPMKFCRFCRNIIDVDLEGNSNGFCHTTCQRKFDKIYGFSRESNESQCYQCRSMKKVAIFLSFNGRIYKFCSFACFFHVKNSCAIFPEQCTICQMYFVQKNEETVRLRHNGKMNVFCSSSCRGHFMYKYQFLQTCSICRHPKSNFNMLKSMADGITLEFKYCSMRCLQIINQSAELVSGFQKVSSKLMGLKYNNTHVIDVFRY